PFRQSLADADEDAGSERNLEFATLTQHAYPHCWVFVRCGKMRHTFLSQSRTDVFQHEAEADVDIFEQLHLIIAHDAGVGMRKKARGKRDLARTVDVLSSGLVTEVS